MTTSETKLFWIDADDWRETAERGQPFTLCDAANNDVATVYHNDHATVTTTPEQAAAYCRMFVAAPALVEALIKCSADLMIHAASADNAAKSDPRWEGVGDRLRARLRQADAALSSARVEG